MNKTVEKKLNCQINKEFWSAYLYLSMSAYFERENLPGFANWMRVQFAEEQTHALKLIDYINERGGSVQLFPIDGVDSQWKDAVDVFGVTLKHEKEVTKRIGKLLECAHNEKDFATYSVLQWYISEQVEEEASVGVIFEQLKMVGDDQNGLLMMDRELASRVFVDATKEGE